MALGIFFVVASAVCADDAVVERTHADVERIAVHDASSYDPSVPVFEPTHEWKTVLPGQAIPGGLHVRMNLETGVREARLLEPEADASTSVALVAESPAPPAPPAPQHSGTAEDPEPVPREVVEQMESAELTLEDVQGLGVPDTSGVEHTRRGTLMDIMRASLALLGDDAAPKTPEEQAAHDARIATMKERMAHLRDVDEIPLEFEASVVAKMVGKLRSAAEAHDEETQLDMLFELEDAVHKYDYGVDFVHQRGLDTVLALLEADETSAEVVRACVELLSAATSNNDKVAAEGARMMTVLIAVLRRHVAAHDTSMQRTLLPAIAKVLRGSSTACAVLAGGDGMDALTSVAMQLRAADDRRGLTRWLVLAGDVLGASVLDNAALRARAVKQDWCGHVAALVGAPAGDDADADEAHARAHADMVRHAVQAMGESLETCVGAYHSAEAALRDVQRRWARELAFRQAVVLDGHADDDGSVEMLDEDVALVTRVLQTM